MAKIEASFPANEPNDRARKRIPFYARVSIQDIPERNSVLVFIDDSKMVKLLLYEYKVAGRMSFRQFHRNFLTRNDEEVALTSISGQGVRFEIMARRNKLSV